MQKYLFRMVSKEKAAFCAAFSFTLDGLKVITYFKTYTKSDFTFLVSVQVIYNFRTVIIRYVFGTADFSEPNGRRVF